MTARPTPCGGVGEGAQLSLKDAQSFLATVEDALNGWSARRTADGRTYVADGHEAIHFVDQLLGELHRVRSALIGQIRADRRPPRRPSTTRAEVPHPYPAEVPPPATVVPQRNNGHVPNGNRRPAAVTRQLALDLLNAEPGITRKEIAARIGVSTRRLREVLASEP